MPHRKRIVVPRIPLHITQRGVRRLNLFRDNEDRCVYLRLFAQASRMFDLPIYAYCLMTNHTHFVAVPNRTDSLWRTFHRVHIRFTVRSSMPSTVCSVGCGRKRLVRLRWMKIIFWRRSVTWSRIPYAPEWSCAPKSTRGRALVSTAAWFLRMNC